MAFWLCETRGGQDSSWLQRFDPRFWTVNFPRPMLAAVTAIAADALRVECAFLRAGDLAGVIWESEDRFDHPLLSYATDRDYSRTTLSFRWRSSEMMPLDAVNGPTLTIEGRDANGAPRSWYVRLWNYATGTPQDAQITLPFSALAGGFLHPAEADPVYPADIDRLFISLVPAAYVAGSTAPLPAQVDGWVELTGIRCDGERALVEIGDVIVPPHGASAATAYDDQYNLTPERVLRNVVQLGYRGSLLHYVGMSHFMRLVASGGEFRVPLATSVPLSTPARNWHINLFAGAGAAGLSPIASISFELLAQYCPPEWQQCAYDGTPARTGWDPPSALLSPANNASLTWLRRVARNFATLMQLAAVPVRMQIGEPWWWITDAGHICLYDATAKAALGGNPIEIADLRQPLTAAQLALLDQAGALLASCTAAIRDVIRTQAAATNTQVLLLVYLPTVLDPAMPEARRANLPTGWASPAYDRLQLEDYDWLTSGMSAQRHAAYTAITQRLGYPQAAQDYLAGFVLNATDKAQWHAIDAGIEEARKRGSHERFVWATPQICRDGFTRLPSPDQDDAMLAFDDVPFPLALGRHASVTPQFSTSIATTASGFEHRNSLWADARLRFDLGPGIRSEAELGVLLAFFRARRGAARGFRLRDPSDFSSAGMTGTPSPVDQLLGHGDGVTTHFALVKRYGNGPEAQLRRITRPVADSILISISGTATTAWTLEDGGIIAFSSPPATGAEIRAGYRFDVPVRFAEDRLEVSAATFAAGEAPSVPVVEIREASA